MGPYIPEQAENDDVMVLTNLAHTLAVGGNICWLDHVKHRKIYVGQHVLSTHYISRPIRYMREIIYVSWITKSMPAYMLAGMHKAKQNICWPTHLECT